MGQTEHHGDDVCGGSFVDAWWNSCTISTVGNLQSGSFLFPSKCFWTQIVVKLWSGRNGHHCHVNVDDKKGRWWIQPQRQWKEDENKEDNDIDKYSTRQQSWKFNKNMQLQRGVTGSVWCPLHRWWDRWSGRLVAEKKMPWPVKRGWG